MSEKAVPPLGEILELVERGARDNDRGARFPVETLEAMRRTGLLGLLVPRRYGGCGGSVDDLVAVTYRLGRHCASTGMIFAMHCQQVAALVRHGSTGVREELLPRIAAGGLYLASVTTEERTGGHLLTSKARSRASAESLEIDRFAPVCTGGAVADGFLVSVQSPNATAETAVTLVYADRTQLDVTPAGDWNPLGMRATASGPVRLTGSVPLDQVVGVDGRFREIVLTTFAPLGHLGWAACWLGCADGALARVVGHLRPRGSSLSDLDRRRLSRIRLRSDAVHSMIRHTAGQLRRAPDPVTTMPGQLLINGVKIFAAEETRLMVDELIELVGMSLGYMSDSPLQLERAWRDLRSAPLNYSNDRLDQANGALILMDPRISHVGDTGEGGHG